MIGYWYARPAAVKPVLECRQEYMGRLHSERDTTRPSLRALWEALWEVLRVFGRLRGERSLLRQLNCRYARGESNHSCLSPCPTIPWHLDLA